MPNRTQDELVPCTNKMMMMMMMMMILFILFILLMLLLMMMISGWAGRVRVALMLKSTF